ncbi:hypothetical protein OKA04_09850 [Luteolibacter flavescens]|uniref:TPM domain-containing protein n=1 Tax=Luteolibacter flavescens TaxID=1859460 RepID=A0ABT3FN75_9BACT|nr:hypothetical protein [Luteolibacter flavescens]MCW1885030.1 hypothetical protein [Luteolibacter flavescens]
MKFTRRSAYLGVAGLLMVLACFLALSRGSSDRDFPVEGATSPDTSKPLVSIQDQALPSKSDRARPADTGDRWMSHARRFIRGSSINDSLSALREMEDVMAVAKSELRGKDLLAFLVAVDSSCPDHFKDRFYSEGIEGILARKVDRDGVVAFVSAIEIPVILSEAMGRSAAEAGLESIKGRMMDAFSDQLNAPMFLAGYQGTILKRDPEAAVDGIVSYFSATDDRIVLVPFLKYVHSADDLRLLEEEFANSDAEYREFALEKILEKGGAGYKRAHWNESIMRKLESQGKGAGD